MGLSAKGFDRWVKEYSLQLRSLTQGESGFDTVFNTLLTWIDQTNEWVMDDNALPPVCKAEKNTLSLRSYNNLLAEFSYKNEHLALSPDFRKRLLVGLAKGDSTIAFTELQNLLSGTGVEDSLILDKPI